MIKFLYQVSIRVVFDKVHQFDMVGQQIIQLINFLINLGKLLSKRPKLLQYVLYKKEKKKEKHLHIK